MQCQIDLTPLVAKYADRYEIRREIVASVVYQESNGNPFAYRFEPRFYERYLSGKDASSLGGFVPKDIPTLASERIARATSWGVMQIMGATARTALNFKNAYLPTLIDPEINIDLGCKYLRALLDRYQDQPEQLRYRLALQSYNGSSTYPDKIFDNIEKGRHLPFFPKGV